MTAGEKEALKERMMPKFKTLQRLPEQERQQYLARQPANDQIEFMKLQFVLMEAHRSAASQSAVQHARSTSSAARGGKK